MSLSSPPFLPRPFADGGDKNTIPDMPETPGAASLIEGFPPITQTPLRQGGKPPTRVDMNGILNLLSLFAFWQQSGGMAEWNKDCDYMPPAIVYGNGVWYVPKQPSGPSYGGAKPVTNTAYWARLDAESLAAALAAQTSADTAQVAADAAKTTANLARATADTALASALNASGLASSHAARHASGGADAVTPAAIGAAAVAHATPLATAGAAGHVKPGTGMAVNASGALSVTYGTTAGTAAQGNDSRLVNARTPTAHAASHASGGADAVTPAAIGAAPANATLTNAAGSGTLPATTATALGALLQTTRNCLKWLVGKFPVSIADGGTGASTAVAALAALGGVPSVPVSPPVGSDLDNDAMWVPGSFWNCTASTTVNRPDDINGFCLVLGYTTSSYAKQLYFRTANNETASWTYVRTRYTTSANVYTSSWARLDNVDATTTVKGVVELATYAEAQAGTDATRAVTPAALKSAMAAGSAGTAAKLSTPRNITLSGAVTGSGSFDGSANITIATTAGSGMAWAKPKTAAGVGQWATLTTLLPSGGTWAYFGTLYGTDDLGSPVWRDSQISGVAAGGTKVTNNGNILGFCWRIA